jgi:hypothetical protein
MTPADQRLSRLRFGQMLAVLLASATVDAAGAIGVRQVQMPTPLAHSDKPLSDGEIYTGSILFPLKDETRCHQLLFDNRTGQFKDNGTVDCHKAYHKGTTPAPMQWSAMRAHVISESFRQH